MNIVLNTKTRKEMFIKSCKVLDIPGFDDEHIDIVVDGISTVINGDDFFDEAPQEFPFSVFELMPSAFEMYIKDGSGKRISEGYINRCKYISLSDVIESLNISDHKLSMEIAKYLIGQDYDFTGYDDKQWRWAMDNTTSEYVRLIYILHLIGKDINDYKLKL